MNKTFSIILFTFVVTGCGMSQKNAAEPKTEETQVEPTTMVADLPSDSTLIRYFFNLPCVWHKMDEKILAKELDSLEKHADIVPETADGMDATSVEWFGGRKGSLLAHTLMDTDSLWVTVNSISQGNENSIEVKFAYDAYEKSIGMKDGSGTLDMTLICEDGHWVVSDFMADGGRRYTELLNDYIQTQRRYFRSSEWIDELNLRLSFHSNYSKNIPIDVIRSHYFGRMRANIGYYQDANAYIHQYPEPTDGNLPDSLILSLFEAIPGCWGNDSQDGWGEERWDEVRMRAAFSDSLFAEMVEAQTMPDTEYDGIPSNDWMRSFLRRCDEGNDHDDSMRVVGVRSELVNDALVGIVNVLLHV